MTNQQVAEAFATGKGKGHSGSMFIDGNTVYSYGYHFPIARRIGRVALFTTRGYSVTTSHHKSCVYMALLHAGISIIEVDDVEGSYGDLETNVKDSIAEAKSKQARARTTKEYWISEIARREGMLKSLALLRPLAV